MDANLKWETNKEEEEVVVVEEKRPIIKKYYGYARNLFVCGEWGLSLFGNFNFFGSYFCLFFGVCMGRGGGVLGFF